MRVDKETKANKLRLPYFCEYDLFESVCTKCSTKSCLNVCETNIIKLGVDGVPYIELNESGCTYCTKCASACDGGMLSSTSTNRLNCDFVINNNCLSKNGVMCFSCKDACYDNAIIFDGVFNPNINKNCTSCGFCISRCPIEGIDIVAKEKNENV